MCFVIGVMDLFFAKSGYREVYSMTVMSYLLVLFIKVFGISETWENATIVTIVSLACMANLKMSNPIKFDYLCSVI